MNIGRKILRFFQHEDEVLRDEMRVAIEDAKRVAEDLTQTVMLKAEDIEEALKRIKR